MLETARSPGSTIAASEFDEHQAMLASSPPRQEPRYVMVNPHTHDSTQASSAYAARQQNDATEDEDGKPSQGRYDADAPASSSRRRKEGTSTQINPMYIGSKLRHLKKDDGEPLWRKDIQYDFLKCIFEDDKKVFTNSYEPDTLGKQTFADLYIDTMARSSKTSKILRDKLLTEHEPARNMAMVCLLVNLGRMNTTLNFFPEMRAQLRTYHAIPSLQAHQDPNSYKQLQDAPRLKSILKGASEDRPEPATLELIKSTPVPRSNPVNMVFVLSQFAPRITTLHMHPERDFYDLLMKDDISSETRARAFLWLLWFYLESDFTEEGAEENPFGPGVDYGAGYRNQGVPRLRFLTPEQEAAENVDPPEEVEFGRAKQVERKRIIESDQLTFPPETGQPKRGQRTKANHLTGESAPSPSSMVGRRDSGAVAASRSTKVKYDSDIEMDSSRSTPPPPPVRAAPSNRNGRARGSRRVHLTEASSPVHGSDAPVMRRARPLTAHQLAVERNRTQRINHILRRGLHGQYAIVRKKRRQEGALLRMMDRLEAMNDPLMASDDEAKNAIGPPLFRSRGSIGLIPSHDEEDDFGEEVAHYASALRRIGRRLKRWTHIEGLEKSAVEKHADGVSRHLSNGHMARNIDRDDSDDEGRADPRSQRFGNGISHADDEILDDMEKEILGLGSDEEEEDEAQPGADVDEEDLDDVDKALLGLRGDETDDNAELSNGNSDGMED